MNTILKLQQAKKKGRLQKEDLLLEVRRKNKLPKSRSFYEIPRMRTALKWLYPKFGLKKLVSNKVTLFHDSTIS